MPFANFALRRLFLMLTISSLTVLMSEPAATAPMVGPPKWATPFHVDDLPPISLKFFQDMMHKIDRDTCVFYYKLGKEARAWSLAQTPPLMTVWRAFDPKSYLDTESPLREYVDADRDVEYWELMCEAYTKACAGHSWVFIAPEHPDEPDNSIWTRVEYAAIKKEESGIVKVDRVNAKGENPRTIWTKPKTGTALQAGGIGDLLIHGPPGKAPLPGVVNDGKNPLMINGFPVTLPIPVWDPSAKPKPPSPMGGQPSMNQNGPPGGS